MDLVQLKARHGMLLAAPQYLCPAYLFDRGHRCFRGIDAAELCSVRSLGRQRGAYSLCRHVRDRP